MSVQEFNTVDVVRLEVEKDPTGLTNLVQNPSGELGGWGWITTLSDSAISGIAGPLLRYQRSVAGASFFTTEAYPITPGQYAAARWEGAGGVGMTHVRAQFEWLDGSGAVLSSSAQTASFGAAATGLLLPVVAPASTVYVRLRIDAYSTSGGANPTGAHSFDLHRVTVAKAATPDAFANFRLNIVQNPSFETNTSGWSVLLGAGTVGRSNVGSAVSGSYYGTLTKSASAGDADLSFNWPPTVTGGETYAVRVSVRAATTARTVRVRIRWSDDAITLGYSLVEQKADALGWTTYSGVVTAPPTAVKCSVQATVFGMAAGEVHHFDAVLMEAADAVGDYFDGDTPDADGWDYEWAGTPHGSTSTATDTSLGYLPPVEYLDIIGDSHEIRVPRSALNVGRLTATVLSRTLDPSQSTALRPGRRARLSVLVDGEWQTIIGGKLLEADVTYEVKDPKVPTEKQARIEVVLVDPTQTTANAGRPEGVATIDELPFVIEGAGVPWNVNGSGNQVPTAAVTTYNENASALDQVALTRDTGIGYAWMSRVGVLNVWDRDQIASGSPVLLDEDDYSDIDLSFSTKDAINEVQITVQSLGADGTTAETVYGPFTDDASIEQWGRFRKEFTVTGLDSAAVETLAAEILAAAATPRIRVNSLTLPLTNLDRVEAHALRDLYDEVRVSLDSLGIDEVLRVTGLEHVITTANWTLRLDFSDEGGVATPTKQPPVQSGIRPDVGVIELFAGDTPPPGKLLCDGSSYAVADYPFLFAVIGYTFGGAGDFFAVPDLTDRFPIGSGTKALGTTGGAASRTLSVANLPSHTVGIPRSATTGTEATFARGGTLGTVVQSEPVGSGTAVDILNPWLSLNFVIRAA